MSTPNLFNGSDIRNGIYAPRYADFYSDGVAAGIAPAARDGQRVALIVIDEQNDFVQPDGTLSVPGSLDSLERFLVNWFYPNIDQITAVYASLDSHLPMQIFYRGWWQDPNSGRHPDPYTMITMDDIRRGVWQPVVDPKWSLKYVNELEANAKKTLMIWPYHTMIGTPGHSLVTPFAEAIAFHSGARLAQPTFLTKGTIPQVEHYGIFSPEVAYPRHPMGGMNTQMLDTISSYDLIYIKGQAKSHCVLESMVQMLRYFANQPDVIRKIRFLTDATNSVYHPDVDFDAIANAELARMEQQGVVMVKTTDPIA